MFSEPQQQVSARRSTQVRAAPLPRSATQQWLVAVAPVGRDEKRPPASLLTLEVGWPHRRASALHLATSRLAEFTNITLKEY